MVDGLGPYLEHLRALPFVTGLKTRRPKGAAAGALDLEVATPSGKHRLAVELRKTNLARELVDRVIATRRTVPTLLLAPLVGRETGDRLQQASVCFVDLAGNCYIDLGGRYVARVQGRTAPVRPTAQKAMRAPAYRALFALLASPSLVDAPVRALAEAAGVSRQAATDIRKRLLEMKVLFQGKGGFGWVPGGSETAVDLFVTGYATTLRPHLLIGRYRTADREPGAMETRIAPILKEACEFRWGGGSALDRMLGYYHGENVVVHLRDAPMDLPRRLGAVADRNGPLHLLGIPGPLAFEGERPDVGHPLLVYVELLAEATDRSREAAQQVAERWLGAERFQ